MEEGWEEQDLLAPTLMEGEEEEEEDTQEKGEVSKVEILKATLSILTLTLFHQGQQSKIRLRLKKSGVLL